MRPNYKILLFLLINIYFGWLTQPVRSQLQVSTKTFGLDNGLESNRIYYIHLAKNGLCYIAHAAGLTMWDGSVFKYIPNAKYPYIAVSNIIELDNGTIFCKAFNGQIFYVNNKDSLVQFNYYKNISGFTVSETYKNYLLTCSADTIIIDDFGKGMDNRKKLKIIISSAREVDDIKNSVYFISANFKDGYIYFVDKNLHLFKSKIPNGGQLHQHKGHAFIARNETFLDVNAKRQFTLKQFKSGAKINYIQKIQNAYWVSTTYGLFRIDSQGNETSYFEDCSVSGIAVTQSSNYLFGTLDRGILQLNNFKAGYISIPNGNIIDFLPSNQNLEILNERSEFFIYKESDNFARPIMYNHKKERLSYFNYFNPVSKELNGIDILIKDYANFGSGKLLAYNSGLVYYGDIDGALWLKEYLTPIDLYGKRLYLFKFRRGYVSQVIYLENKKLIYILNYDGLFEISPDHIEGKKLKEPYAVVSGLFKYNNSLCLLTKDKNLLKWDGENYTSGTGILNLKGVFIKKYYYQNELWLQTFNALYCIRDNQVFTYTSANGLVFSHDMVMKFSDKYIYSVINNKILVIPRVEKDNPSELSKNISTKILIRQVFDNHGNSLRKNIAKLDYKNNSIEIWFALKDYNNSDRLTSAYSINDGKLIFLSAQERKIYLNNLEPGDYAIKLFAVLDRMIIQETMEVVQFTVNTPFYRRWWFIALVALACMSLFFGISYIIILRLKREQLLKESKLMLEKELGRSVLSGIKSQMNPHFIFNALNTIQSYIYKNDKENASTYISKFSKLTRNILNMSSKEFVSLAEELESLQDYLELEKMRFTDTFVYQIDVEKGLDLEHIDIPGMLLQPYVENAIKHGLLHKKTNRILKIEFKDAQEDIKILIDDNGIGRKASAAINKRRAALHQSFALEANLKRMEILRQQFSNIHFEIIDKLNKDGIAEGTLVVIQLPKKLEI